MDVVVDRDHAVDGLQGQGGGGGGEEEETGDAVMRNMIPTPDQSLQNSESSRPHIKTDIDDSIHPHTQQLNKLLDTLPLSPPENSQLPSQSPPHIPESQSKMNTLLPSFNPSSPTPHHGGSWSQTVKSPTSGSNPFYTSQHSYRSSTPPIPSSAEQSPLISPAKRFSTGEVKPLYTPNSPRQPLNEEDRLKFSQAPPSPFPLRYVQY